MHTPGPWIKDYGLTKGHIKSVAPHHPKNYTPTVCRYDNSGNIALSISEEEQQANGHLIAAAPDLLAALKALTQQAYMTMTGGYQHLIDNAQDAIDKAEGRI